MNDPFETYQAASNELKDCDQDAGSNPGFPATSDELEQAKYDASQNISAWQRFWNP